MEITFLPNRLNKKAVVYNSMTFAEIGIICILFGLAGSIFGLLVMLFTGLGFYVIFIGMFGFCFIGLKVGGSIVASIKRGKPDSYFERLVALKFKPQLFVTKHQNWSKKRSPKVPIYTQKSSQKEKSNE